MILYPEVQRKAQAEIDQVVGNSRLPNFSDQEKLPYVQAVLKEVLRWHPVAPLSVSLRITIFMGGSNMITLTGGPRKVTESDLYEGYYIPAGSTIIANAWYASHNCPFSVNPTSTFHRGMLHDPAVFAEPDRFHPERWLSPDAPAFPIQAFGFGARQCPGRILARASILSNIVGILAAFNVTPGDEGLPEEAYSSGVVSCVAPASVP